MCKYPYLFSYFFKDYVNIYTGMNISENKAFIKVNPKLKISFLNGS